MLFDPLSIVSTALAYNVLGAPQKGSVRLRGFGMIPSEFENLQPRQIGSLTPSTTNENAGK